MTGAREFVAGLLKALDFKVEEINTPLHPILLGERPGKEGYPRLVIYGHYDVQPADPLNLWTSPAFEPEVRGGRLYGRGTADNKGPQIVHLCALAKVLAQNPDFPCPITYLIEGEEEIGSPSFSGFLEQYTDRVRGDVLIVSDTGSPNSDQIVITTGLRGLAGLELTVTGPSKDLHSGVHGGALMNPIQALSEILASLHTPDGLVNVPGFYDDVLPVEDWEREELSKYPNDAEAYQDFLGVPKLFPTPGHNVFEAVRFAPTLEFNGIGGGYQGEGSKTVIPSKVMAKITCRLVPNQDPADIKAKVARAIEERCPPAVSVKVDIKDGGHPYLVVPPNRPNTPRDLPIAVAKAFELMDQSIHKSFGKPPLYLREGGSIPIIADLKKFADLNAVMVGLFTPEDNLHAPDESFHLDIMDRGIEAFADLFKGMAEK